MNPLRMLLGLPTVVALMIIPALASCQALSTKDVPQNPAVKNYDQRQDHDDDDGDRRHGERHFEKIASEHAETLIKQGREIFRYDTFGSEDFWGGKLKLHEALAGQEFGGTGAGLTARQALDVGLKVDVRKLPSILVEVIKGGSVSLDKNETTMELLRADAVVGVRAVFDGKTMKSIGITCALCHSTVDDSLTKGIGRRLDGWPNRDLNIGAIVALAPDLSPIEQLLGVDRATLVKVLQSWGPGKYDAELIHDGKATRPDGKSGATVLPAAFGLAGVSLHTYTGWGGVPHWNAYVAVTQMHGKGTFYDPRLNDPERFPVAARTKSWNVRNKPDLVTAKLPALHLYQLSIPAPKPPKNSFDSRRAARGQALFNGKAGCARCHVPPLFTEPGWPMHTAAEIGIDDFQANRSPDVRYRTTPLKGLFVRQKGGFYHDGRFPTMRSVVDHYVNFFKLQLSETEKQDLVEYLKSL
jgi:hypothetical protein